MIVIEVTNLSGIFGIAEQLAAQDDSSGSWAFLGADSLAWLVLAFGAAMVVGNILAVVKPPEGQSAKAPLGRSVAMISIGAVAAIWGLASLLK